LTYTIDRWRCRRPTSRTPNNHAAVDIADAENPNNHNAPVAATAARAEPDVQSQFGMVCCRACNGCTLLALAALLV
jgi:hypothetical protein